MLFLMLKINITAKIYPRRDLNPHALRPGILSPLRLPFRHMGIKKIKAIKKNLNY